ncbi:histidine phosphatase family protein [Ammoniphilus sp. YIM 78166]|uniref:histidine phosphatase family protein n=1 Tax=Ammoniphilus sp. YIM 78166 TaxID=1644106 RepID=UPI001430FE9A|nr:histidine phosphatase family protein [Ammoniphilus sp. YIM 78166]
MANHFYLIRHGETDWNRLEKLQGHTDIPLNQQGLRQAELIAQRLSKLPLKLVCSSDLKRAMQTAKQISSYHSHIPFLQFEQFRERNYGEWEGLSYEEIKQKFPFYEPGQKLGGHYGIEKLEDMQDRALRKLEELSSLYPSSHIAVISHGGLINALLALMTKGEHGTGKTKLNNTSYNHLTYQKGNWSVHTVNDASHLE